MFSVGGVYAIRLNVSKKTLLGEAWERYRFSLDCTCRLARFSRVACILYVPTKVKSLALGRSQHRSLFFIMQPCRATKRPTTPAVERRLLNADLKSLSLKNGDLVSPTKSLATGVGERFWVQDGLSFLPDPD